MEHCLVVILLLFLERPLGVEPEDGVWRDSELHILDVLDDLLQRGPSEHPRAGKRAGSARPHILAVWFARDVLGRLVASGVWSLFSVSTSMSASMVVRSA